MERFELIISADQYMSELYSFPMHLCSIITHLLNVLLTLQSAYVVLKMSLMMPRVHCKKVQLIPTIILWQSKISTVLFHSSCDITHITEAKCDVIHGLVAYCCKWPYIWRVLHTVLDQSHSTCQYYAGILRGRCGITCVHVLLFFIMWKIYFTNTLHFSSQKFLKRDYTKTILRR